MANVMLEMKFIFQRDTRCTDYQFISWCSDRGDLEGLRLVVRLC